MIRMLMASLPTLLLWTSLTYAQESSTNRGESIFKQCAGCHGADGHNKAFGKSGIIAGQSYEELFESIKFYRESEFQPHTTSFVMSKQARNMSMQDLTDVINYISKLPK